MFCCAGNAKEQLPEIQLVASPAFQIPHIFELLTSISICKQVHVVLSRKYASWCKCICLWLQEFYLKSIQFRLSLIYLRFFGVAFSYLKLSYVLTSLSCIILIWNATLFASLSFILFSNAPLLVSSSCIILIWNATLLPSLIHYLYLKCLSVGIIILHYLNLGQILLHGGALHQWAGRLIRLPYWITTS